MSNIFNISESRKRNQMCIAFSQVSDGMKNARRKRGTWTVILRSPGDISKRAVMGLPLSQAGILPGQAFTKNSTTRPDIWELQASLRRYVPCQRHSTRRAGDFFLRIGNFCGHFHHGRQYCKGRKSGSTAVSIRYPAQCAFGNSTYNLSS